MSKASSATIRCTKCRATQAINIWESVTANRRPDLKQMVLDGSIFRHVCEHCGARLTVTHPILYHDPDEGTACWLCDGGITPELEDAMDSFGMVVPKTYSLRLVYSLDELAEKVRIWDSGLNDWFVHMLKMSLADQAGTASSDIAFLRATPTRGGLYSFSLQLSDGRTVSMSDVPNVDRTCRQWSNLEPQFDWLYVSDNNFAKLLRQYGHLLS